MPDISMCEGGDCPARTICYRHTAKPSSHRQAWDDFPSRMEPGDAQCESFMPLYEGKIE